MDKLSGYLKETIEEMRFNVSWPTATELQKNAGLVLVGTLVFALVVGVMDFTFDKSLTYFYNSF
jgi:preprotein translocase subunit SecE